MVQAEDTRHFSASKWDYHHHPQPPTPIPEFFCFKWSGACLAAPCPGRVPRLGKLSSTAPETMRRPVPAPSSRAGRAPGRTRRESAGEHKGSTPEGRESAPKGGEGAREDRESTPAEEESAGEAVPASYWSRSLAPHEHPTPPNPGRLRRAEEGARSGAADAEPLGSLASPCRGGRAPRTPPDPRLVLFGRTGHPEPAGQRVAVQRPAAPVPPPRRLATHRDRAGRWALFHCGRGEAGRGAGAERGAGRGGRPCAEGGGGRRREPLARSRSAAAGADCRKSKHFGRKSES